MHSLRMSVLFHYLHFLLSFFCFFDTNLKKELNGISPDVRFFHSCFKNRHGTSPFESVKDARSAIRFLKKNGHRFGIDTSRIVASGGSAGGHLAACTALIDEVNEPSDDFSFSPVPYALVLFNPVVDTGKRGYGFEKVKGREFEISPVHHITEGVPPTLIMHGKDDKTVPYENVVRFSHETAG